MHSGERLDVLFNNAGILASGPFETVALAKHEAMLTVNVLGMIVHAPAFCRVAPCGRNSQASNPAW